ncbi:hypothetical protein FQA39_LY07843 [Lamprigera yunnana]|nr:hypothetical protein FQA39_LY07843 [Lamprigera yunnana]
MKLYSLSVWSVFALVVTAKKLPDDFKLCRLSDPNYNECLKDATLSAVSQLANGIKEIDAPPLEPLEIAKIEVTRGPFSIELRDLKFYDITKIKNITMNSKSTANELVANSTSWLDEINGLSNYSMKENVRNEISLKAVAVKSGQYSHYRLTHFSFHLIPNNGSFYWENIINGNAELSDAINQGLNDNWKVLLEEFLPELEIVLAEYLTQYINNIFKYVPILE